MKPGMLNVNRPKFVTVGKHVLPKIRFYNPEKLTPRYQQAAYKYAGSMLLSKTPGLATKPYYQPELTSLLHKHLPNWYGFQTQFYSYLEMNWSSIFGDWDYSSAKLVHKEEQPLLQRDRLMQIFGACPRGSYGYYAYRGLTPFKALVGSYASAAIDEFFASNIELLRQPFTGLVNDIMSTKETVYWNSQQEFTNWLAGQLLGKDGRSNVVRWSARLSTFLEGWATEQGTLAQEQLKQIKAELDASLPGLDQIAFEDFLKDDPAVLLAWQELRKRFNHLD
jgi:hypothetical protein